MTYDALGGYVLLFGGYNRTTGQVSNDTWTYAAGKWSQLHPIHSPSPRDAFGMVYDPTLQEVVLFGGYLSGNPSDTSNQTWTFNGENWTQLHPHGSPPASANMMMVYDPAENYTILFGGVTAAGSDLGSTWEFSNDNWSDLNPPAAPSPRDQGYIAYDARDGYVLLFGGEAGGTQMGDTWIFESGNWTELTPNASPSARSTGVMVYDPSTDCIFLFGGYYLGTGLSDVWTYSDYNWTLLNPSTVPPSRYAFSMSEDPKDGYVVLYGGNGGFGQLSDTWNWEAPDLSVRFSSPTIDLGQTIDINVTARSPAGSVHYTWNITQPNVGCTVPLNGTTECTPSNPGSYFASINATDAAGGRTFADVGFEAFPDPMVVTINSTSRAIDVDGEVTFAAHAMDGTGVYRQFDWTGIQNSSCSGEGTSVLVCRPASAGVYAISATVTDSDNFTSPPGVAVPLVVYSVPSVSTLVASRTVADVGQTVSFTMTATGGSGFFINYSWRNLTMGNCSAVYQPNVTCSILTPGIYNVSVQVEDSFHIYSHAAARTVTLRAYPRLAAASLVASSSALDVNQSASLSVAVSGGAPPLQYIWSSLPPGCPSVSQVSIVCTPIQAGTFHVSVVVLDAANVSVQSGVVVLDVAPSLAIERVQVVPSTVVLGGTFSMSITVVGGTLPYTFQYSGYPKGCEVPNSDVWSCTPSQAGGFAIGVTVLDSARAHATQNATLTVSGESPPAKTPVNSTGDLDLEIGAAGLVLALALAGVLVMVRRSRRAR